jgi:hypothetical protein
MESVNGSKKERGDEAKERRRKQEGILEKRRARQKFSRKNFVD